MGNNPMGSFGALAYTQYGNLPLIQLVSITGLSGVAFLINWFGASVNWMWERSFAWPVIRRCVVLYGTVAALVLLYGGARLALPESPAGTMQIASFTGDGPASGGSGPVGAPPQRQGGVPPEG